MRHRSIVLTVILGFCLGLLAVQHGYGQAVGMVSLLSLGLVSLTDEQRRTKAARVREAIAICGFNLRTAAHTMGLDPAELNRALSADRKLDTWRLEMLGDEFMRVLALLELRDRGLPSLAKTAVKIAPALSVKESA